jgi:osmotically-inducible protein OsmY
MDEPGLARPERSIDMSENTLVAHQTRSHINTAVWGLAILTAVLTYGLAAEAAPDPADDDITTVIDGEFWLDDVVDSNVIDVSTVDGVVTLSGTVDNLLTKERAAEIAANTVGVRAVVNLLTVRPQSEQTDLALEQAVRAALLLGPATDSYEVDVSASEGQVTLTGAVQSWQEKRLSETVASSVAGVTDVTNEIQVAHVSRRSDFEIETDVEARLANDVLVDDFLVTVDVSDGVVTLDGTVGSLAEKNRAIHDAWVNGTTDVDGSHLDIEWWARDSMRRKTAYTDRTDADIETAVRDAFIYDPRVLSYQPGVSVSDGTVTLSGSVDSLAAKRAAEADARNVVGVWRVKNRLKVRPPSTVTNTELEADVLEAFDRDPYLVRWDIEVEANYGLVTLSGTVNTSFEKKRAEYVAEGVPGVTAVLNRLDFDHRWMWKPDREIAADIHDQLWWSPFVDADQVEVSVQNGVATLSGTVDTWAEWDAATENAFEGGAKDVRNELAVTYPFYGPRPFFGSNAPMYPHGY